MTEPVASYVIPRAGGSHSDYIVYVDESGDHSLTSINPRYPLFVLSFCVFRKSVYNEQVAPALRRVKCAAFGHDMVVLQNPPQESFGCARACLPPGAGRGLAKPV